MGAKDWLFLMVLFILISGCSINKTQPVVTDITGSVVYEEVSEEETVSEEAVVEEDVISEEVVSDNETTEEEIIPEEEINETEEQEEELPPGTHIVTIKDLSLSPKELTIKQGDTVVWKHEDTWENDGETRHYLAAHSNEFRSPIFYYGETFEHTFENEGTFTYIDVLYKDRGYMRGEIVVE
jgi:plastocyanin